MKEGCPVVNSVVPRRYHLCFWMKALHNTSFVLLIIWWQFLERCRCFIVPLTAAAALSSGWLEFARTNWSMLTHHYFTYASGVI